MHLSTYPHNNQRFFFPLLFLFLRRSFSYLSAVQLYHRPFFVSLFANERYIIEPEGRNHWTTEKRVSRTTNITDCIFIFIIIVFVSVYRNVVACCVCVQGCCSEIMMNSFYLLSFFILLLFVVVLFSSPAFPLNPTLITLLNIY